MNATLATQKIQQSVQYGAASHVEHNRILPREQLILACRKAQAGDVRAREMVVNSTSRLAHKNASVLWKQWAGILPPQAEYCDIYQAAIEGILHALTKYDPDSGNAFTTYAQLWIRQRVQRAIWAMTGSVRITERMIREGFPEGCGMIAKHTLAVDDPDVARLIFDEHTYDDTRIDTERTINELARVDKRYPIVARMASEDHCDRSIAARMQVTRQRATQMREHIGELISQTAS